MKWIEKIETWILYVLIGMLLLSVILGTIELGRSLVQTILFEPPFLLISPHSLFDIYGLFLVVLIGTELPKLLKLHLQHHRLSPVLVIEVAIIAACNKVVTLDIKALPPQVLLGIAALIVALAGAYYAFSNTRSQN